VQFTAVPPRGASGACTLCYRETAIRLYDPPTPALRSCPGSCRCVGSPALKNVKSDEQSTAAAPLSPTLRTRFVPQRPPLSRQPRPERPESGPATIRNCVRTETVESCTLYCIEISESLVAASSSCPSRSDSLFLSRAHVATWTYMSHFARRIISSSVREKRLHQRVELDRVIHRL